MTQSTHPGAIQYIWRRRDIRPDGVYGEGLKQGTARADQECIWLRLGLATRLIYASAQLKFTGIFYLKEVSLYIYRDTLSR